MRNIRKKATHLVISFLVAGIGGMIGSLIVIAIRRWG